MSSSKVTIPDNGAIVFKGEVFPMTHFGKEA